MRANIGFILIGLGLVGTYIALGGKFGKSSGSSQPAGGTAGGGLASAGGAAGTAPGFSKPPFASNPTPVTGGASQPANVPNLSGKPAQLGSGGESIQSRLTQLGHVLALHPNDRYASRGGF